MAEKVVFGMKSGLHFSKRLPLTLRKTAFYIAKGLLLQTKKQCSEA